MQSSLNSQELATNWLNEIQLNTSFKALDKNRIKFNSPITDSFGDQISLLIISNSDSSYLVTDQGYTLWNLTTHGINLKKDANKTLHSICNSKRVDITKNDEFTKSTFIKKDISQVINDVLAIILEISNLAHIKSL